MDISGILNSSGVALEKAAVSSFGTAVDQYRSMSIQNIADMARAATGTPSEITLPIHGNWNSTQYANDMVKFAAKSPFLFKVSFQVNPPYESLLFPDASYAVNIQYVVRSIDRPKVQYNYEEVNMYNFRTKVLKSITHGEMSMILIDDVSNTMHYFLNQYRMAHSPLSRRSPNQSSTFETSGMNFAVPNTMGNDSATRGVLVNGLKDVLKSITISQVFGAIHGAGGGAYMQNNFVFINPRIASFDFDQATHDTSDGGQGTISFDYDALQIYTDVVNGNVQPKAPGTDINVRNGSTNGAGNGIGSGFLDAVSNVGSRILGQAAGDATRKLLAGAPPLIVGPLGELGYAVNSNITDISRNTLRTASQSVNQMYAAPTEPQINDNSSANTKAENQISSWSFSSSKL